MAEPYPPMPPMPPMMPPPSPPPSGEPPIPWEQEGYPALEGLFETAKLFITDPAQAFRRMPVAGDVGRPLLYAVILGWIGIIASQIYNLLLPNPFMRMVPMMARSGFRPSAMISLGTMVVAPLLILLFLFIWAGIVHLCLSLVGGATAGFMATLRVMAYGSTVNIFQILPFCGGLIAFVWAIVLEIMGLATAHRTTQGKAALAVLLPLALCCVCVAVISVAFGAAIAAAIAHNR